MILAVHEAGAKKIGFDLFFTDRSTADEASAEVLEAESMLGLVAKETGTVLAVSDTTFTGVLSEAEKKVFKPVPAHSKAKCSLSNLSGKENSSS